MANGTDKYRSRRNRLRVRELLWRDWDPIGVNYNENLRDEYDPYADRVYVMLMDERCSAEEISAYLCEIISVHMGLRQIPEGSDARSRQVANTLAGLIPEFEAESNDPF